MKRMVRYKFALNLPVSILRNATTVNDPTFVQTGFKKG